MQKSKNQSRMLPLGSHPSLPSTLHQALQEHRLPNVIISLIGSYLLQFQGKEQTEVNLRGAQIDSTADAFYYHSFDSLYMASIPLLDDLPSYNLLIQSRRVSNVHVCWLILEHPNQKIHSFNWTMLWNSNHRLLILGHWMEEDPTGAGKIDQTSVHVYQLDECGDSEETLRISLFGSENKMMLKGKVEAFLPHSDDETNGLWFVLRTEEAWLAFDPKNGWKTKCSNSSTTPWWKPRQYSYAPFLQKPLSKPFLFFDDVGLKIVLSPTLGIYLMYRALEPCPWAILRKSKKMKIWVLPKDWEYLFSNALGECVFYERSTHFKTRSFKWWLVDPFQCTKRLLHPPGMENPGHVLQQCSKASWVKGVYCPGDPSWLISTSEGKWLLQ